MDKYPSLRPETIRVLIVHSASWTSAMLRQFNCDKPRNNKNKYINLIRICGFGVPNLTGAISSMQNDFTMIIEDSLQPYKIAKNAHRNNEIKFYSLPFPQKELLELGGTDVEMRVTLSYFIEPNPSSRGQTHHSYRSHGLRFDVKNPSESKTHFMGRLTKAIQEEGIDYKNDTPDRWWTLGKNGRTKGSIHSDIWRGAAVDLAGCGSIAIYPVSGWWRDRQKRQNLY